MAGERILVGAAVRGLEAVAPEAATALREAVGSAGKVLGIGEGGFAELFGTTSGTAAKFAHESSALAKTSMVALKEGSTGLPELAIGFPDGAAIVTTRDAIKAMTASGTKITATTERVSAEAANGSKLELFHGENGRLAASLDGKPLNGGELTGAPLYAGVKFDGGRVTASIADGTVLKLDQYLGASITKKAGFTPAGLTPEVSASVVPARHGLGSVAVNDHLMNVRPASPAFLWHSHTGLSARLSQQNELSRFATVQELLPAAR